MRISVLVSSKFFHEKILEQQPNTFEVDSLQLNLLNSTIWEKMFNDWIYIRRKINQKQKFNGLNIDNLNKLYVSIPLSPVMTNWIFILKYYVGDCDNTQYI